MSRRVIKIVNFLTEGNCTKDETEYRSLHVLPSRSPLHQYGWDCSNTQRRGNSSAVRLQHYHTTNLET